jgi:hypothetical protein
VVFYFLTINGTVRTAAMHFYVQTFCRGERQILINPLSWPLTPQIYDVLRWMVLPSFWGHFQNRHTVSLADTIHSQYAITSHLLQMALNFDAGSISRARKGKITAKFLPWPIFQCRCSYTSTCPSNIISLADTCAIVCKSALLDLLPPTEKQNYWLTQIWEARETSLKQVTLYFVGTRVWVYI